MEGHRTKIVETPASGTATTIDFTYEGDKVVREVETTGSVAITRTFTVDETGTIRKMVYASVPADTTNDGTYLPTYNGHGDLLWLARLDTTTGNLVRANRFHYSTWGTPVTTLINGYGDLGFRYQYVGQHDVQWDNHADAGLLYMHARHYHPEFARFLQPDPSELEANLYAYAENSPVTKIDPSGELAWFVGIAFLVVRAVVVGARVVSVARALRVPFAVGTVVQYVRACNRQDWVRAGWTRIPNDRYGLLPRGGYTRVRAIRGGGTHPRNPACRLPFRYHIHMYNWSKPHMWLDG